MLVIYMYPNGQTSWFRSEADSYQQYLYSDVLLVNDTLTLFTKEKRQGIEIW